MKVKQINPAEIKAGDRVFYYDDTVRDGNYWNGVCHPHAKYPNGYKILETKFITNNYCYILVETHSGSPLSMSCIHFKVVVENKIIPMGFESTEAKKLLTLGYR